MHRWSFKIRDACIAPSIRSLSPYQMLRREKARFVLGVASWAETPRCGVAAYRRSSRV